MRNINFLKSFVMLGAIVTLVGCGGGGSGGSGAAALPSGFSSAATATSTASSASSATPVVAPDCTVLLWGDSILRGDTLGGLLPESPAAGLKRMRPSYTVVDDTQSGDYITLRLSEFLNMSISSRFIVLEDGMNDAGHDFDYEQPLRAMVQRVKAQGKTPIVTGLSHVVDGVPHRDAYDAIASRVAKEERAVFADWGSVQYAAADMADDVHPAQPYSTRLTERLAATLDSLAPECAK